MIGLALDSNQVGTYLSNVNWLEPSWDLFIILFFVIASLMYGLSLGRDRLPVLQTLDARERHPVKFYLVAVSFLLFDVEVVFLFPWAVVLKEIGTFGFVSMMIFLAILVVGFIYEWMRGALEWE